MSEHRTNWARWNISGGEEARVRAERPPRGAERDTMPLLAPRYPWLLFFPYQSGWGTIEIDLKLDHKDEP